MDHVTPNKFRINVTLIKLLTLINYNLLYSYYCEKCLEESEKFYDNETKACVYFTLISLDLIRGNITLQECQDKLQKCLVHFVSCRKLSLDGQIYYLKARILANDITYAVDLLGLKEENRRGFSLAMILAKTLNQLLAIETDILGDLRISGGESVEYFVDSGLEKAFFNTIEGSIRNLYSPLLFYLCHTKLRLGSVLILRSSMEENETSMKEKASGTCILYALNVLCMGIELNKVGSYMYMPHPI